MYGGVIPAVKALDVTTKKYIDVYIDAAGQRICIGQMWQRTCYGATQDAIAAFRLIAEHPYRVMVVRTGPNGVDVLKYEYLVVLDAAGVHVLELWIDQLGRLKDQYSRLIEIDGLTLAQRVDAILSTVLIAVGTVATPETSRVVVRVLSSPIDGAKAQFALYLAAGLGVMSKEAADQYVQFLQRFTATISNLERRIKELEAAAGKKL